VQRQPLTGREVEALLLLVNFVGESTGHGHPFVVPRIPCTGALNLMRAVTEADVLRRLRLPRSHDRQGHRLGVVSADRCVEAVAEREVPVRQSPAEPERLHEQISHVELRRVGVATAALAVASEALMLELAKLGEMYAEYFAPSSFQSETQISVG